MGCLDTYKNPDQMMSPRLSFSKDFVESHHAMKLEELQNTPPKGEAFPDFEFSVSAAVATNHTNTMTAADELFFKGKLLPTLRDELLVDHDEDDDELAGSSFMSSSFGPPKGLPKWKDFLSLKIRSADGAVGDGLCTASNNNKAPKIPK